MISQHLQEIAENCRYQAGFRVEISIEQGAALASKTMNPRLGIVGGLSILGATGIVRPFSCGAWIASIRQGIHVAHANGLQHIAASTGNLSEAAIREQYDLPDMALIEMGDYVGAVLRFLRQAPVAKLSICGGVGKISKLALGHMDLHSRKASIDFQHLGQTASELGAAPSLVAAVSASNTSLEAVAHCRAAGIDLPARTVLPGPATGRASGWRGNPTGDLGHRSGGRADSQRRGGGLVLVLLLGGTGDARQLLDALCAAVSK